MTTRRGQSAATGRVGVNFVRDVVERANCVFQEIEQSNDIGNDAYIEFVVAEEATGCCIAAQIKSGLSYLTTEGAFVLTADRDHFEYWSSHVLPVSGVVVDPVSGRAGWCDITAYLHENPGVIQTGPFRIPVPSTQEFNAATFEGFRQHFIAYQRQFSDDAHFGAALERFTPPNDSPTRIEALKSLFSYHRNRTATWCYVASLLRSILDVDVLRMVVLALSHVAGHGDIYVHEKNEIASAAKRQAREFLQVALGREDVVQLLRAVDENGFARGTVGQSVHSIIDLVRNPAEVLRSIAFDSAVDADIRETAIFLFVYYAQDEEEEPARCIHALEEFRRLFPDGFHDEVLVEMIRVLREHGSASFY
jgi:hypothetical protein